MGLPNNSRIFGKHAEHTALPPMVTLRGSLPGDAGAPLLDSALGAAGDDPAVQQLVDTVRRNAVAPVVANNSVQLLVDGPQTFASIRAALEGARHHIHLETYIFADDELGKSIAELLIRKRQEGVEVRVLYDGIGSLDTPADFFDHLREGGVEVHEFRPLNPVKTPLIWKINNRDHRKIVIVDGRIGFTGGINISGAYSRGSASHPGRERGLQEGWRDTHVRIEGPVVRQLQALFLSTWTRAGGKIDENSTDYFPEPAAAGNQLVSIVANDGDHPTDRTLYATYLTAISSASRRIWITQAYFAPNEEVLAALIAAVQRKVDVRLIVPGFTDSGLIFHASRASYDRLLRGGIRIYEQDDALLHAKTAVIDQVLSVVGSANLDMRSFLHNNEVNALVIGRDFGGKMEALFQRDLNNTRELDLKSWRKRPLTERMKEFGSKLFGYWL